MDIFPLVNLTLILLWLAFFLVFPAWRELKVSPLRSLRKWKE
jgi:hypothetical protein